MIVAFLGPSLPLADARAIVDADFRPPAAMGDVLRAVAAGVEAIALVDGVFERVPAVWHKEILFALARGIPVYGASSMGALRAAECHAFGMVGVGAVFEAFRSGSLTDDDEVAVAHAGKEHGYRCLSDAMVNVRQAVHEARERGLISEDAATRLVREAKARFYADRSWVGTVRSAASWLGAEPARLLLEAIPTPPDVKRADAALLMRELAALARQGIPRHVPSFDFEPSPFFLATLAKEAPVLLGGDASASGVPSWKVSSHVRLSRADRNALAREALFDLLVAQASATMGLASGSFIEAFAAPKDVETLARRLACATDALVRSLGPQLEPFLAVALSRRGDLGMEAQRAARKWAHVADRGLEWPQPSDAGTDMQALSDWYEANFASLEEGGDAHARDLGFGTWEEFMGELVAEYMWRKKMNP
jgi:hypothetical protein